MPGLPVQLVNHPDGKINVDPFLFQFGPAFTGQAQMSGNVLSLIRDLIKK
jgi:hypothetical protein